MRWKIIIPTIFLIVILITSFIIILSPKLTGKSVEENSNRHSYTKAICDENNLCEDYEIICDGPKIISITPITGAFIKHKTDWTDPRARRDRLCE